MPDKKVTMVAFHGDTGPTAGSVALRELVKKVQDEVSRQRVLGLGDAWDPSKELQIHATLIGMEADLIGGRLMGHWFLQNRGELRPINVRQLLCLADRITKREPIFTIRFGGFRTAVCTCVGKSAEGWDCATSDAEFHSCDRAPWEGSFYGYPGGPVLITGWPAAHEDDVDDFRHPLYDFRLAAERPGYLDKYHSNADPHWMDDDCYIKIGGFKDAISADQMEKVETALRKCLAAMPTTTVDLTAHDVLIVKYSDASLAQGAILDKVSLLEGIRDPTRVERLYQ